MIFTKKSIFKRLLLVSMVCVCVVGVQSFSSNAVSIPGESRENPILINSAGDFDAIMQDMDDGETFKGKFLKLNKNIFLTLGKGKAAIRACWEIDDEDFLISDEEPSEKVFQGFFDGNGKTIYISMPVNKDKKTSLIFDVVDEEAVVQNLKITATLPKKGLEPLSAIICNKNFGTVKNCTIKTDLNTIKIVGENKGNLQDCVYNPSLKVLVKKLFSVFNR